MTPPLPLQFVVVETTVFLSALILLYPVKWAKLIAIEILEQHYLYYLSEHFTINCSPCTSAVGRCKPLTR